MKKMYAIQNTETREYLASINIGCTPAIKPMYWRKTTKHAIHFENPEEANSTITFIGDVLDWELEQQLEIVELQEE